MNCPKCQIQLRQDKKDARIYHHPRGMILCNFFDCKISEKAINEILKTDHENRVLCRALENNIKKTNRIDGSVDLLMDREIMQARQEVE